MTTDTRPRVTAADRWAETHAIRDAIRRISSEPRTVGEIRDQLRAAGIEDLGERRLYRALTWLLDAGVLARRGTLRSGSRYVAVSAPPAEGASA